LLFGDARLPVLHMLTPWYLVSCPNVFMQGVSFVRHVLAMFHASIVATTASQCNNEIRPGPLGVQEGARFCIQIDSE
jgi:hypothetical protein